MRRLRTSAPALRRLALALAVTDLMAKKRNLEGYQQKGKRFIPPMKQVPGIREHSYVDDMLPELIWLGLIHDRVSYRFGTQVLEAVVEVTKNLPAREKPLNFALQSAYTQLSEEQKEEVVRIWERRGLLTDIRYALAPLVLLYDGFGLAFVGPPQVVLPEEVLIARIRESVGHHLNRFETPAVVLHGAMMLTRMIAGTIHFAAHIDLPDFNAIVTSPDTDEARRAASFMRAHAGAEWGMLDVGNQWARYFWNRGAQLTPCERPDFAADYD